MKKPALIGILNCTPDSFYDGGKYFEPELAIARGLELHSQGADLIDVGGQSTKPGAQEITIEEELQRVIPVVRELNRQKIPIAIDTFKPQVAQKAIENGARFINDITGFSSESMCSIAAQSQATLCLMHMQGNPQTMQTNPHYSNGILKDLLCFFRQRIKLLLQAGVLEENIAIDPGIGYGKTVMHNIEILKNLKTIKEEIGLPIYLGISRKSFMSKILGKPAAELLAGTLSINSICFPYVDYLRVHDVKEHRQMIDLLYFFNNSSGDTRI